MSNFITSKQNGPPLEYLKWSVTRYYQKYGYTRGIKKMTLVMRKSNFIIYRGGETNAVIMMNLGNDFRVHPIMSQKHKLKTNPTCCMHYARVLIMVP